MTETVQRTLDGDTTDDPRIPPDTFVVCERTDQRILRSRKQEWPHPTVPMRVVRTDSESSHSPYEHFDADDEVGAVYDVEISQSVSYRFQVPAEDKHRAKEIAKDWLVDATPADAHTTWTDTRKQRTLERRDLPDSWDPYDEPLKDAYLED